MKTAMRSHGRPHLSPDQVNTTQNHPDPPGAMTPHLSSVTSNRGRTVMKLSNKTPCSPCLFTFRLKAIHKCIVVVLALPTFGAPLLAAPARAPKITLIYTTAETSSSAEVVWNTNTEADSLLQYSTSNPVPAQAPQVYLPTQLTLHEIPL